MNRIVSKSVKVLRERVVLFRNSDYLAINKPIGFKCSAGKAPEKKLRGLLESMELVGYGSVPVPITSLPSDVSGVLMMSRNPAAGQLARGLIKSGQFWRCTFWGIVQGRIAQNQLSGVINIPLLNGEPNSMGPPAITHWRLLKYADHKTGQEMSLVEFEPRTSVDDQIKLHCALTLKAPLLSVGGLHLHCMHASLPGSPNLRLVAPPTGEFLENFKYLGWV